MKLYRNDAPNYCPHCGMKVHASFRAVPEGTEDAALGQLPGAGADGADLHFEVMATGVGRDYAEASPEIASVTVYVHSSTQEEALADIERTLEAAGATPAGGP